MRFQLLAALIIGIATLHAMPIGEGARADARTCPAGREAENRFVSAYRRGDRLLLCFKQATVLFEKGERVEASVFYFRRTARLNGPVLAYAEYGCDEYYECNGRVRAADVIHDYNGGVVQAAGPEFSQVGEVRVTRDLRLAWTSCRTRKHSPDKLGSLRERPRCGRQEPHPAVWIGRTYKTIKLDRHTRINPLSLQLRDRRLSWKRGKRRRSYDVDRAPEGTPTPIPTAPPA